MSQVQTQPKLKLADFVPGQKAHAVKQKRDVTIVTATEGSNGNVMVKVKGLDPKDGERIVILAAEVNGEVFLRPAVGAPQAVTATKTEAAAVEEKDAFEDEDETAEAAPVTPATKVEEGKTGEDILKEWWLTQGFDEAGFDKLVAAGNIEVIKQIQKSAAAQEKKIAVAAKHKGRETNWETAKLKKYFDRGELTPVAAYLNLQGLLPADITPEDQQKMEDEAFDAIGGVISAAQYTAEARRSKPEKQINTATKEAFTLLYKRLASVYPVLVQYGLVEDTIKIKVIKRVDA